MVQDHYGVWLFQSSNPLSDARLWRESHSGWPAPTRFSRALGIRSSDTRGLAYRGIFGELSSPAPSVHSLLAGLFVNELVSVRSVLQSHPLAAELQSATGYAVLACGGIRQRSVPGLATLVAMARVRREHEP